MVCRRRQWAAWSSMRLRFKTCTTIRRSKSMQRSTWCRSNRAWTHSGSPLTPTRMSTRINRWCHNATQVVANPILVPLFITSPINRGWVTLRWKALPLDPSTVTISACRTTRSKASQCRIYYSRTKATYQLTSCSSTCLELSVVRVTSTVDLYRSMVARCRWLRKLLWASTRRTFLIWLRPLLLTQVAPNPCYQTPIVEVCSQRCSRHTWMVSRILLSWCSFRTRYRSISPTSSTPCSSNRIRRPPSRAS